MTDIVEIQNPAKRLSGMELNNRWVVGESILVGRQGGGNGTGGNFSVSYRVKNKHDNSVAFLKAFDFHETLKTSCEQDSNVMMLLASLTSNYKFEHKINEICSSKRFKKIVRVLDSGQVFLDGNPMNVVPYLIMEMADNGDIRKYVEISDGITISAKLQYLKDVAIGLKQLHGGKISHQDLKPSNVMIFSELGAKIGDLGRASLQGHSHWHDEIDIAGDMSYAPLEQLYGHIPTEWIDRRERCDLYQFGSIVTFLFLGVTINGMLKKYLKPEIAPRIWGGQGDSYLDLQQHLEHAFNQAVNEFDTLEHEWLAVRLKNIVIKCSHPDYKKRGMVKTISMKVPVLGLDRLVSEFEHLIKLAYINKCQ